MSRILLIDDDADLILLLREELVGRGHHVDGLERAEQGPDRLATGQFDLVLLDNKMPGMTGMDFLKLLRSRGIAVPVILITSESTPDTAIQATKLGAFDYVVKAGTVQELAAELDPIICRALEIARPVKEVRVAPGAARLVDAGPVLIGGKNRRMLEVYKLIAQFADGNDPVLILGETGTGKELVARAFHTNSSRKSRPFVALNCAAIPENLLESELFGHEKGAHSQADKLRKGKIEYADGGTLFLDEIGDMPLELQRKLLRVIEYQSVERLGGNESVKVDVRLVSATHRDLETFIQEGTFRRDLFFRLNRVTLRLPALRERLDDLPELAEYFLERAAEATSRGRPAVTTATLERLRAHHWPGNVRELQNVIFRAFGVCRGPQVLPSHLDFPTEAANAAGEPGGQEDALARLRKAIEWAWATHPGTVWPHLQERLEEELLRFALDRCAGNQSEAAKKLGMGRTTLIERVKKYGLLMGARLFGPRTASVVTRTHLPQQHYVRRTAFECYHFLFSLIRPVFKRFERLSADTRRIGIGRALVSIQPNQATAKHHQPEDAMKTSIPTLRTADSNVRTPALPATTNSSKATTAHSSVASRFLNALMRALAAPHS